MVQPETNYARLGADRIAYQVIGRGPPDLVLTLGSFGTALEDRGTQQLKGVEGTWRLSTLVGL